MRTNKLIFKNLARSIGDYLIYFMTLVISISIFYAFNAVVWSDSLACLSQDIQAFMQGIGDTLKILSRLISVLIGFLILYVNRFLMRRRQKELGIYMLLGMKKQKISMIFVCETFLVGLLSLVAGMTAGVFLAQILAIASLRVFGGQAADFVLTFSTRAFGNTVLCFGIIYILAMLFNVVIVSKTTLINLLTAERRNEELKERGSGAYVLSFGLGVLCLVTGAFCFRTEDMMPGKNQMLMGGLLVIAATFLIFYSAAAVLLLLAQRNKAFYFKGIHCFTVRQLGSRIRGNFASMSVVCLLLTVTILLTTIGASIAITMAKLSRDFTPYDFVLIYEGDNEDVIDAAANYEYPADLAPLIAESFQITHKSATDLTYGDLFQGQDVKLWDIDSMLPECMVSILGISEYNRCLRAQGYPEVELSDNEFLINCNYKGTRQYMQYFAGHTDKLTINGVGLVLADKAIREYVYEMTSVSNNDRGTLIVPDAVADLSEVEGHVLQGFWKEGTDTDAANETLNGLVKYDLDNTPFGWTTKARIYSMYYLSLGLPVFILTYIGIIFMLICVALLSIQQLTEMSDNRTRFQILKNQGVSDKMMKKAIRGQVGICFGSPLVLAGIYTAVSMPVVMDKVSIFFNMEIGTYLIVTLAVMILVYGGYYIATFVSCERLVFGKN